MPHKPFPGSWPREKSKWSDNYYVAFDMLTDEQQREYREYRNTCANCGRDKQNLIRKNYDMMWGEAELWCTTCDTKVRDLDYG